MFLYFITEIKPVQTLCRGIQNILRLLKSTLSATQRRKLAPSFSFISHLFCGKISWENTEGKSSADTFTTNNTFSKLPLPQILFSLSKQVSASTINIYQSMLVCHPTQLCSGSYKLFRFHVDPCQFLSGFPLLYFLIWLAVTSYGRNTEV